MTWAGHGALLLNRWHRRLLPRQRRDQARIGHLRRLPGSGQRQQPALAGSSGHWTGRAIP